MLKFLMVIIVTGLLSLGQGVQAQQQYPGHRAIRGQNSQGDLTAENLRERIIVSWPAQDGATSYIIYRATSMSAPWAEMAKKDEKDVTAFAGYEDVTELAQTNDLCYKVEAINEVGQLVRVYESVCVPKFVYR
jgi:hypothetical protein